MNDDTTPTQSKKPVAVALIPSAILAVIAAIGWYLYWTSQQENEVMAGDLLVQVGNFEARVLQLEQERDALQASLDDERQTREQVQDSLASQRDSLAALKSTLAAEQASAAELQASLERARDERRQLESDLQQEVERLASNSAELEQALAQHQAQQQSLQQRIEAASAEKEQLGARLEAASAEKEQLGTQLDEAQARREELQDQIAKVNAEVAAKEAEVAAKAAEVAAKEAEVAAKEAALAAARDDIAALNGQLAQTREEKNLLEARLVDLSEQQKKEAAHFALLQSRLEQELNEHRVEITQLKNRMTVINLTSEVLFDSGSIEIKPAGRKVLSLIAESLNAYPEREISIDGHTDNVPVGKASRFVSNWDLSTTRAIAAVDHLQRAGVSPQRLRAVGHGEHKPVASNASPEGRQRNRRIEIRLLPELDETS